MPKRYKGALRGAEMLGLARIQGNSVRITPTGAAVGGILDTSPSDWSDVHLKAIHSTLADVMPRAGAAPRILLLRDPMVRLIVRGLKENERSAPMPQLVKACDALGHDRTPALFFHPERSAEILNDHGQVRWSRLKATHYRSTTFYQIKSMLKHAGIPEDTVLGGSSVKDYDPSDYDPSEDVWTLGNVV
jgi:hypothetical protein